MTNYLWHLWRFLLSRMLNYLSHKVLDHLLVYPFWWYSLSYGNLWIRSPHQKRGTWIASVRSPWMDLKSFHHGWAGLRSPHRVRRESYRKPRCGKRSGGIRQVTPLKLNVPIWGPNWRDPILNLGLMRDQSREIAIKSRKTQVWIPTRSMTGLWKKQHRGVSPTRMV